MRTFHIHITGIVQGVGFRPHVCKMALEAGFAGTVSNENNGVHIFINCIDYDEGNAFLEKILAAPPQNALIAASSIEEINFQHFEGFTIAASTSAAKPNLLLTPDIALCEDCKKELGTSHNKRHHYAFTTCLQCGPRFSITKALPYDRENTTMDWLEQCSSCEKEYHDIYNRRHYSQTNSCPQCEVPLQLFNNDGELVTTDAQLVIKFTLSSLREGKIIAVKGVGGYLLVCDATNDIAIKNLRERKHRPAKPFALMYSSLEQAMLDVQVSDAEVKLLSGKVAPIVLCAFKPQCKTGIISQMIAPGLDKLGIILPYTPLLQMIADKFGKPLVATSGNLSGSPIVYKDEDALLWLCDYADYVLGFRRDIVTPQDDSVIQLTKTGQQIILRRSRGLAPGYYPNPFSVQKPVLAMGAELKAAFALLDENNLYISQFLGDIESYESQESYKQALRHFNKLLHISPATVLVDKHPGYHVSDLGRQIAEAANLDIFEVQHHIAHFCAVMQEHNLMRSEEPVLGIIWDGTGYGDDHQIWGGEFFTYRQTHIERVAHIEYFPLLSGDKMAKEPRVSALALLRRNAEKLQLLEEQFNEREWLYYMKLIELNKAVQTSSMGRLLDGIAAILQLQSHNSYEGEVAMKLEVAARASNQEVTDGYKIELVNGIVHWQHMVDALVEDRQAGIECNVIAKKVFITLVVAIRMVAEANKVKRLAFSGGVFQNAFLVETIQEKLVHDYDLYFHQILSPNDECISFGQIAWYQNR